MFYRSISKNLIDSERNDDVQTCSHCGQKISQTSFIIPPPRKTLFIVYIIFAALAITAVTSIFYSGPNRAFLISSVRPDTSTESSLYSPFEHGLRYGTETTPSDYWQNELYMGEPSDESEQAWNYLIHPNRAQHGIRFYPEEAKWVNISESIRLTDDSFAVVLQVHHNLHCLRRIRQMFYEDHYYPNQSEEDRQRVRAHNIHCLESLRTSTICRPDLAPLPFYWSGNDWHQMNVSPQVKRECVNWEVFQEHVTPRSYDTSELVREQV